MTVEDLLSSDLGNLRFPTFDGFEHKSAQELEKLCGGEPQVAYLALCRFPQAITHEGLFSCALRVRSVANFEHLLSMARKAGVPLPQEAHARAVAEAL